jgi:hypothetical protein
LVREFKSHVTAKLEQFIIILDTLGLEAYVATPHRGPGRPPKDRPAIARAFVGKAVLNIPTTIALIERLQTDRSFRAASAAGSAATSFRAKPSSLVYFRRLLIKPCPSGCTSS